MINIYCDSVLYGDGNGKVEGSVEAKGPRKNLTYEIYTILKYFESDCLDPYTDAMEMIYKDTECNDRK